MLAIIAFVIFVGLAMLWYTQLHAHEGMGSIIDECRVLRVEHRDDMTIEIVDADCKEGLPHTTGPYTVRMTEAAWAHKRRNTTLVHEHVHLEQKRKPHEWYEWYRRYWEYELLASPPPDLPAKYIAGLRPNPDTADAPWALWRHRWLFFPNYTDSSRTLRNARVLVWDTTMKKIVDVPAAWKDAFCSDGVCPHQYEHPHELSAEYIADGSASAAASKLYEWRK
jgi:hypothetical protein